ncbi:serine threonine kinase family [Chlorella sorokiniana]|uniref:Serine threonine kinase family n=1 Tax=Chlorella sorokiniana TaxID=3076 RepID=A0A2P6U289_CHLSO|nr:serine threonine kinase family [Chlorella sorokiniana]|eukprot:PRW60431.1 serine threonine kinase family [Chlorella sorokiniana]
MNRRSRAILLALFLAAALPAPLQAVSWEGLRQAVRSTLGFFNGSDTLQCADCLQLAADIELQLFKPPDVESDDPNIAAPGPGRRMRHRLREDVIHAALDAACDRLAAAKQLAAAQLEDCKRRMVQHRLAIGDAIFDRGAEGLAALVCVERFALCQPHHISEGGAGGEL